MRCGTRGIALLFFTGILLRTSATDAALEAGSVRAHRRAWPVDSDDTCHTLGFMLSQAPSARSLLRDRATTPHLRCISAERGRGALLTPGFGLRTERRVVVQAAGPRMTTSARELRLEEAMEGRIRSILRIPPAKVEIANAEERMSPPGLARQEFREEERGLCKIRRYNPDMLRPKTISGYFDASARLAQVSRARHVCT